MAESKVYDQGSKQSESDAEFASATVPPARRGFEIIPESDSKLFRAYSKPVSQVSLVGLVCFLCPGMFNAITGIGGGGQVNASAANKANVALYSVFAVVSFFAGTIHNRLGSRPTLCIGALGYSIYLASFLSYNVNQNEGFVVAAGAILGFCASLLWTAQGALMLAYPTEQQKGYFISVFWIIFNMGAVLGSSIQLGLSYRSEDNTVGNGVYIGFIVLTALGALASSLLRDPARMIRDDWTPVVVPPQRSWLVEFQGLFKLLMSDPWVALLFPLFLASNWFYTWQFNNYNSPLFTLRTRALNNLLYWLSQMVGSYCIGLVLDNRWLSRRARAWIGWSVIFVLVWAVWGGNYAKQRTYERFQVDTPGWHRVDFTESRTYTPLCFLYIFNGIMDTVIQNVSYWLIGSVSNDLAKLGFLVGFYKSFQSAGAVGAFAMDEKKLPFMTNLAAAWALCGAGLVIAVPVLFLRVTNHTNAIDDTVTGEQTEQSVAVATVAASNETSIPVVEKA